MVVKPPTARMPRTARREQLLEAAASVFARTGFSATSMDDVALAAGVTRLVVYRHFSGKDELYRAVLAQTLEAQTAALSGTPRDAGELRRRFVAQAVLAVARAHPDGFRLLWGHAAREPEFANYAAQVRTLIVRRTAALFEPLVHDAVARAWAAATLVDYLFAAVLNWLEVGDPERDPWVIEVIAANLAGQVASEQ